MNPEVALKQKQNVTNTLEFNPFDMLNLVYDPSRVESSSAPNSSLHAAAAAVAATGTQGEELEKLKVEKMKLQIELLKLQIAKFREAAGED